MLCLGHALIHPGVAGIVHQNVHLRNRNEYNGFILPYQIVCILCSVTSFCQAGYCEIPGSAVLYLINVPLQTPNCAVEARYVVNYNNIKGERGTLIRFE